MSEPTIPFDRPSRQALAARLELSERNLRRYLWANPMPAWLRLAIKAAEAEAAAERRQS